MNGFAGVARRVIVLLLVGAPALAATVLPGDGAQRTFIWHAGESNVGMIVMTPVYETVPNSPPFQLGSRPPFDPNLPEGPNNRVYYTVWVPGTNSSILERIFASMGADAEPGTNPDTGKNDDPAPYAYAGSLADRASPFRGLLPPTRNGLEANASGQAPRAPLRRAVNIGPPLNGGSPYPNASVTGDSVDPRVSTFFNDPSFGWNGPVARFPNFIAGLDGQAGRVFGFGGDFNGITACLMPSVAPNSSAQSQIAGVIHDPGCIPNQNIRATGGAGELPARPAPGRGNLDASTNPGGAAQGVSFPFPAAAGAYERNVDPATGRPRIAGATGSCTTAGAFTTFFGAIEYSGADSKQFVPMQGGLGMGVDPDCLKPGGAAGGVNENRWDPADYAPLLAHYADPVNNPLPLLYDLPGSSPQNALEHHSANQGLFAWSCLATRGLGFLPAVDPNVCLLSSFGSAQPLGAAIQVPLSEVVSTLFAGERDTDAQNVFRLIESATKQSFAQFTPVRNLNVDFNDGAITAFNPFINKGDIFQQVTDWLTLDSTLSNEQRALLGCGPFYGTRCDSGVGGVFPTAASALARNYQVFGFGFEGGIDLLNAEASAIMHAWPGTFGTNAAWTTTSQGLTQPGTIGFAGGPVCTREVNGETVILPGCRGVQSLVFDGNAGVWLATFDDGYTPARDGCVLGATLTFAPVTAVHADGSPVDLTACATTSRTREGNYLGAAAPVSGARTLWHPLAGCKSVADSHSSDPNVRACDFRNRNFELEFFNGTAQIFRSEIAALSWNALQLLIVSSCDTSEDVVLGNSECFNPEDAWSTTQCSFAAPQLCRNVQILLALALDEDRNGVPDGVGDRDGDGFDFSGGTTCSGGATTNCQDNCPTLANPDQADQDSDGIGNVCDNCSAKFNPGQEDAGGVGPASASDGIGNACQCGDVNDDGFVTGLDGTYVTRAALKLAPFPNGPSQLAASDKCDVGSPAGCSGLDGTVIKRASLGLPPGVQQVCPAAVGTP